MHQRQDRPPGSPRPSLLSPGQAAEAGKQGILSQLDGKTGPKTSKAPARKAAGAAWRWAGSAALLLALCAGAAVWLGQAAPAPAAPLAPVAQPEVSAAAILNDTAPAEAAARAVGNDADKPARDELARLFEAEPAAAAQAGEPVRAAPVKPPPARQARAEKVKEKAKEKVKTTAKPAARPRTREPATRLAKAPPAKKPAAKVGPAPVQDSDVLLLAALVAHSKAHPEARTSPVTRKIGECKKLGSVAESDACRAKVCAAASSKDAACKGIRVAQAASDA